MRLIPFIRFGIGCFLLLNGGINLRAQPALHFTERLTTEDGLSSNAITDIAQDSYGFLWIATAYGLNRYDGTEVVQYLAGDSSNSLPDNTIYRMIPMDSFHFALATHHGLAVLDTRSCDFKRILLSSDSLWESYDNWVLHLEKDALGNFWVGTPTCIFRLDKDLHLLNIFRSDYRQADISRERMAHVYKILPLPKGRVLFWLSQGLYEWQPVTKTLVRASTDPVFPFLQVDGISFFQCFTAADRYLLFLDYMSGKLHFYDVLTHDSAAISFPAKRKNNITEITKIDKVGHGEVAISFVENGVMLLHIADHHGKPSVVIDPKVYFPNYNIRKWFRDEEGNHWIATAAAGLIKISPGKQFFREKRLPGQPSENGLNKEITSLFRTNHSLFIASYGTGFYRWDLSTGKIRRYTLGKDAYLRNMIWNFRLQGEDTLWIGTQEGLYWYNLRNDHTGTLRFPHPHVLDVMPVTTQFTDTEGWVWMGLGKGNGVCRYNPRTRSFHLYPNADNGYPYRYPMSIAEDSASNLWFVSDATTNLVKWDRKTDQFTKVVIPQFKGKAYNETGMLYLDSEKNVIWYGVQSVGLIRYDITTSAIKTFGTDAGIRTDRIFNIRADDSGKLWLSTIQGITCFDPSKERAVHYNLKNGLPFSSYSAMLYDGDSAIMYAASPGKIIYFSPSEFRQSYPSMPVRLTQMRVNNHPVPIPPDRHLTLHWHDNDITLSFTGINLANGVENRYAYKLENDAWKDLGSQRQIRFASLNPGHYKFSIKGARKGEGWSPLTDNLELYIRPPFTRTVWFYLVCIAFIAGSIYGWYRYRLMHLLRLERMRSRISHDLHDDIGSRITNVGLMSQIALQEKQHAAQKNDWLLRIQKESEAISQSMREIIWNIDPDNDSLEEALPRMLRFATGLLEAKKINVQAYIPNLKGIKIDMEQRRDLFLIFKEAIHNVSRHAEARQTVITVNVDNKLLKLQVTDDGKGFEMNGLSYRSGLVYMQQRAVKNHWNLTIDSRTGQGTTVILEIRLT